jgi:hypothetical protein
MKIQKKMKLDVAPFSHEHHLRNKDVNILKYTFAVLEQNFHAIIQTQYNHVVHLLWNKRTSVIK